MCNEDVKSNPGLKKSKEFFLSCCHWNVSSPLTNDCAKVTSLETYNSVTLFGSVNKMYLDPIISSNSSNLNISRYNLIRAGHPSSSERGGVY